MADNSILRSLTQIESDLEDINSAKEQIEIVSNAYGALQEKVRTFVEVINGLSQNVQSLVNTISDENAHNLRDFDASLKVLETQSATLLSTFQTECNNSSTNFGRQIERILGLANSEISNLLEGMGNTISGVKEDVQSLVSEMSNERANDLKKFESSLKTLETESSKVSSSFQTHCNTVSFQFKSKIDDFLKDANEECTHLHAEIEKLNDVDKRINTSIEVINSLRAQTDKLLSELKSSQLAQDSVLTAISTNVEQTKDRLSDAQNKLSDEIQEAIVNINEDLRLLRDLISTNNEQTKSALSDIQNKLSDEIQTATNKIININEAISLLKESTLQELLNSRSKVIEEIETKLRETDAQIKVNKKLIIGTIILLIAILIKSFI